MNLLSFLKKYIFYIIFILFLANTGLWYSIRYLTRAATPNVCFTPAQIQSAWVPTDPANADISRGTGHCYYIFKSESKNGVNIDYPQYTVFEKYQTGTVYNSNSRPHQGVVCGSCVDPTQCPGMGLSYTALDPLHFHLLSSEANYLAGKEVGYTSLSCGTVSATPIPSASPTAIPSPIPTITPEIPECNLSSPNTVGCYLRWVHEESGKIQTKESDFTQDNTIDLRDFEFWRRLFY